MSLTDMLLENRIIFLSGPIVEQSANVVIQQLLYLQSVRRDQSVNLYINSPGGPRLAAAPGASDHVGRHLERRAG